MEKNYVVYHLHSDLSNGVTNIDSVTKYNEYIDYAKSLGMKAMAFSEHGSVLEWVHKKNAIEKAGMKYIHAEEFYVTKELYQYPDDTELCESLLGTDPEEAQKEIEEFLEGNKFQVRDNYHCVLIAKNYEGVKEINALSSKAFARDGHFYYQPRISFEELINTSDNILITTACIGGILASGTPDIQEEFLNFLVKNKDRCYLEIQHHCDDMQIKYNQYLAKISTQYGIPLIAGTDTHSLNDEHMRGRAIMQRSKDVKFDSESAWDMTFKSYDELIAAYEKQFAIAKDVYLKAIEETNRMADRIEEFYLDYSYKYPKLYEDSLAEIKKKIVSGIKWRGIDKKKNYKEYQDRIVYELKTYIHNNALDFMLLEEDYKTELRKDGVKYGYSRGSVSGSLIAYLLGITEVDPIRFNLNFERFMNEERVSLADIDSDWFKEDRWKVREYLFNREKLYCCNIITFNTVKMKGAIKDVGRALGMTPQETQALSNLVQEDENKHEFVEEKYRLQYQELFEYVDIVVGTITSLGRHAAGLVVSPYPVEDVFGTLYISSDEKPISQINMKEIDSLNFVKLDVLGLDCVGLIYKTCEAAGIPFLTPDNLDFNDEEVWEDIAKDTTLIFQFESDFAGSYLRDILRPQVIKKIKEKNPNLSYIDLMSMANGAIRPAGESYRTKLAAECTAKRMVPDYISEKVMLENKIDKNGNGNVYGCMGCRSFLTPYINKTGKSQYYGRFNQGVVTLNLVDIALSSGGDIDSFWTIFDERSELCHKALKLRHERLEGTLSDVAPVLYQDGAFARLKKGEKIDELLHDGYSTISLGYAGLYECVKYMTGNSHTDEDIGTSFGLEVMKRLNDKCNEWKEKENIDYSLYGSPIESTTYKFAKCLKKRFGVIDGITDRDYITNSYHVPVFEEIDPFKKLELESKFQKLSPGGAISYVECADLTQNTEVVIEIMKFIYEHIMYAELNTKSDYCQECGYNGEIKIIDEDGELTWECPNCGNRNKDKMNVTRRTCGYIGTNFWNQGRTEEIKERYVHVDDHEAEV